MTIGFCGLGQMGKHMARNMGQGSDLAIVCALTPEAFPDFEKRGVRTTTDFHDLVQADIIFLSLPNGDVVKSVLLEPGGVLDNPKQGQIVVDTSTIGYTATLEIADRLRQAGIAFLDAPVSGMEARAADATLTIMCGGDRDLFAAMEPYLRRIGDKILYMGKAGSGQLTKLINQLLFDINAAALAEILPLAAKLGLDCDLIGEVVNSGTGRSYASEFFIPRILQGEFTAGYPMKHAYKDLVAAAEMSARLGVPLPVLGSATCTYQTALLQGHGDLDKGAMIRVFEDLLGVHYRSRGGMK
jgi:3-hydroxyisobutyrate dehydrogenase-like beta-hydroxyacid dehydrogenase